MFRSMKEWKPGGPEDEAGEGAPAAGEAPPQSGTQASGAAAAAAPPGDSAPPPAAGPAPAPVLTLSREEYEELTRKAGERDLYRNELLRARADFDNYQKRVLRDRPQIQEQAVRRFLFDLLPVLDNFERALGGGEESSVESVKRGILIVRQMLEKSLRDHGVEEIEALGKPFDPLLHEAVVHEETDASTPGTVSEVLQKGYTHKGTLVRPARVKVARAPSNGAGAKAAPPPSPRAAGPGDRGEARGPGAR